MGGMPKDIQRYAEQAKRNDEMPAHSVSIEIHSGIARFPCYSTAFLLELYLTISKTLKTEMLCNVRHSHCQFITALITKMQYDTILHYV